MISKLEKKLLHYTGKAIADYEMIHKNDSILVCLSGGKDSFALLQLLRRLQLRTNYKFDLFSLTIDQGFPGWQDDAMRHWLKEHSIPFEILKCDTLSIIKAKLADKKNYCSFCSRLRRGIIYSYAQKHGFKKIALGHNREDLISSLLMSILYSGEIRSMPPKLITNTKKQIVIRPLVYCQEKDILAYKEEQHFPCLASLCGLKANTTRPRVKDLIEQLARDNPKVPSNILHALQNIKISQLMDKALWNFKDLDEKAEI